MASGRVGGTKSKVSGTIGSEVYSLRRNPDGTYSQVVSAKPETTTYTNTEKQAAQRRANLFCRLAANFYSLKTKDMPAGREALGDWLGWVVSLI